MLNNQTDLPEAGWYVDPANPANERWWGGLEWTDTTRELRVKPAAMPHPAQPVFTGSFPPPNTPFTSTGGFPPAAAPPASFPTPPPAASFPAPPAAPPAAFPAAPASPFPTAPTGALAIAAPVAPTGALAIAAPAPSTGGLSIGAPSQALALVDSQVGLSGWVPAPTVPGVSELSIASGYGSAGTAPNDLVASPSWYSTNNKFLGPPPTNRPATAGLVLSFLLLAPLGFIVSIVALAKSNRIHREGFAPIGRRRAAWGLALSIAVLIAAPIGISIGLPILKQQQELALEQLAAQNAAADELVPTQVPIPLTAYDRAAFEQGLADGFTQTAGSPPESVTCPDTVATTVGSSITCEFVWQEQPHTMTMVITNDAGNYTLSVDGVVQE